MSDNFFPPRDERQKIILKWVLDCFGTRSLASEERASRFVEEAIELAQAAGVDRDRARLIVDVVYGRPAGDVFQELGGVGLTLLALAESLGYSADIAEQSELTRVLAKSAEHFRARHAEKHALGISHVPEQIEADG